MMMSLPNLVAKMPIDWVLERWLSNSWRVRGRPTGLNVANYDRYTVYPLRDTPEDALIIAMIKAGIIKEDDFEEDRDILKSMIVTPGEEQQT
jgi:hypothetical protein